MEIRGLNNSEMISKLFKRYDTDSNDGLSSDEFSALNVNKTVSSEALSKIFANTDADGNGSITQTELSDSITKKIQEKFESVFTAEVQTQLVNAIESGDTETAASIIESVAKAMRPTYSGMKGPQGPGGGQPPPPPPDKMFSDMDTDSSGTVTLDEFTEMGKKIGQTDTEKSSQIFSEIDSDGDGVITFEELMADMEKRKIEREDGLQANGSNMMQFAEQLIKMLQEKTAESSTTTANSTDSELSGLIVDKYA